MENFIGILLLFILAILINVFLKPKKKYKRKGNKKSIIKQKQNIKEENLYKYYRKKTEKEKTQGYNGFYKKTKKYETQKTSYKEKQKKGKEYEKYISEYYKKLGWITYENGLEKGWKDGGIDLILKKENTFLFVQCKNWNKNHKYKMGIKKIKEYREKTKKFMINNPKLSRIIINLNYQTKLTFISSEDIYTLEAKKYIKENKNILEYHIIPINNN